MKYPLCIMAGLCLSVTGLAQIDSTGKSGVPAGQPDTIHVGNMTIVRDRNAHDWEKEVRLHKRSYYHSSNITTNWMVVDLGFANYNDKTNYLSSTAQQFAPGATSDWFRLRYGKSVDVNIWLFMQQLNVIKHVVNLEYGLGIELNNYRYSEDIRYLKNPTQVMLDTIDYRKDKLAADYVTVPFMLNFNFTPHRRNAFGISLGASAGYLYSSRQKFVSAQKGKTKTHDDFDLQPWKISWIGELQLGPVILYGSYATQSMFKTGLDQTPYTVGIRLSNIDRNH